jgi:hypothetical protein
MNETKASTRYSIGPKGLEIPAQGNDRLSVVVALGYRVETAVSCRDTRPLATFQSALHCYLQTLQSERDEVIAGENGPFPFTSSMLV